MADFELEDSQGNRYRIRRGAGPQFWHTENLAGGSTLLADELLCNVPVSSIDAAHNHFYSDVLTSLPNRQSSPQGALSDALSSSHLTIEKIGTALVISDDVPDPRNELIVKIRNALTAIVAGERAEAAMHTRLLDEENTFTKSMIYTGAFMQGIGSSAWGMVVWLKEVSDVVNPFVKMQHHAKALQVAWESEDFSNTYSDTYVKGEKRELVEALGFDPSAITEQQIDEAMAMTSLVMDDPSVRGMLYQFTKDYAEAQHAVEITNVIGSAVFEIILAIVMAAVTGGVGVVAAVGSKAHLIKKFQKVGDLLQDFAKATRSLKLQAKKRKTKGNQNAALPVEKVDAKKTDAHGAEDGKPSEKKEKDRDDDRDKEDDKPGGTAKPTPEEIELAKSKGSTPEHIAARDKVARHYLENNGFTDGQISNALGSPTNGIDGGVDLLKPLEVVSFPPPDTMTQFVKSHGFPGNWFDPMSSQTPDSLGLNGSTRSLKAFKVPNGTGLKSYAKPVIDDWTVPEVPVETSGGGVQLLVNDSVKKSVVGT